MYVSIRIKPNGFIFNFMEGKMTIKVDTNKMPDLTLHAIDNPFDKLQIYIKGDEIKFQALVDSSAEHFVISKKLLLKMLKVFEAVGGKEDEIIDR